MIVSRRLIALALPLLMGALLVACTDKGTADAHGKNERADDMAMGSVKAPVQIIEYASLTCPHCAEFHEKEFPKLKAKYIDTGKVRFIFRQYPTAPVPFAVGAEAVARCAGPDKYFGLLDVLFDRQSFWIRSANPRQALLDIAATAGITKDQFDACVSDEENVKRIQDVSNYASQTYKITGTPSFIINGKYRPKIYNMEGLEAIIEPLLGNKAKANKAEAEAEG